MAGMIWKVAREGRADREVTLPLETSLKKGDFVNDVGVVVEIDDALGNLKVTGRSKKDRKNH